MIPQIAANKFIDFWLNKKVLFIHQSNKLFRNCWDKHSYYFLHYQ